MLAAVALVASCASVAPPFTSVAPLQATPAEPAVEEPVVSLELVADTSHATPGGRFRLGARLSLPAGWHVGWTNPGDAGRATTVDVTAPPGWTVGPPRLPGPERFEDSDGNASYGYADEVLVLLPVRAPLDVAVGSAVTFELSADWLARSLARGQGSFRQSDTAALTLDVVTRRGDTLPHPVHGRLFERFAERLPRPFSELGTVEVDWTGAADAPELGVRVPAALELEFFPARASDHALIARTVAGPDALELRLRASSTDATSRVVRGLLRVRRAEHGPRYYRVAWTRPAGG